MPPSYICRQQIINKKVHLYPIGYMHIYKIYLSCFIKKKLLYFAILASTLFFWVICEGSHVVSTSECGEPGPVLWRPNGIVNFYY